MECGGSTPLCWLRLGAVGGEEQASRGSPSKAVPRHRSPITEHRYVISVEFTEGAPSAFGGGFEAGFGELHAFRTFEKTPADGPVVHDAL
jgi:hypothetical protein